MFCLCEVSLYDLTNTETKEMRHEINIQIKVTPLLAAQ